MDISTLLSIVADAFPDRVAVRDEGGALTYRQLQDAAAVVADVVREGGFDSVSMIDTNSVLLPVLLFGASQAGVPFVPLNYRLADDQLDRQVARLGSTLLVCGDADSARLAAHDGATVLLRDELLTRIRSGAVAGDRPAVTPSPAAAWLFTSGTTGDPKIVVLRHENLVSYVLATVAPLAADESEAALTSVPPYHIAGLTAVLTSIFAARQIVYLTSFEERAWIELARAHQVSQAMVVPTMLERILDVLELEHLPLPALRSLSYGGGRMPVQLIERALRVLPDVAFTNAYGLTETSSTVALLSPDDHRTALASADPSIRARLGSVGRPLPGIDLEIRDDTNQAVPPHALGEIWVRGPQIAGEYKGTGSVLVDGWFCTRDEGWLDDDGYLFVIGRADDVIVRGGENISPGEIEDVLRTHPSVADVAVVAEHDPAWGEAPVAVVVVAEGSALDEDALTSLVRGSLRSSRVPTRFVVVDALPYNETGKLLRKVIRQQLPVFDESAVAALDKVKDGVRNGQL